MTKNLIRVLSLVLGLGLLSSCVVNTDRKGRDVVIKVVSKETISSNRNSNTSGRDYRVYADIITADPRSHPHETDDGVFNINDDLLAGAEKSSTIYGHLLPDHTYLVHVVGRRYASAWLPSKWPNIIRAEEVEST